MKIGLNATCLSDRPSGAKQRFIGIYNALFKRMPNAEFTVYQAKGCDLSKHFDSATNVTFINMPIPTDGRLRKFFTGIIYWRKVFKVERFDIFEGFHLPFTSSPSGKNILTMHDIRGVSHYSGLIERVKFSRVLKHAFQKADLVITVSESMRTEILDFSPNLNVSVIFNGINEDEFSTIEPELLARTQQKFSLADNFLLTIGHFEKRKNYTRLIEALAILHKSGRRMSLVIVGNDSGEMKAIKQLIEQKDLIDYVIILNGISDAEVRCLYKLADLFVFPSFYEGFGIPVLEAMAASCPMVLSDTPVFREITQNQGLYFTCDEANNIASAIQFVLNSDTERSKQIDYGKKRVKDFSFSKIAAELEKLYLQELPIQL